MVFGRRHRKWIAMLATMLLFSVIAGCGGSSTLTGTGSPDNLSALLPPLPVDVPGERTAASTVQESKDGADNWENSGGVAVDDTRLIITSSAGELEYAVYRYIIGLETATFSTAVDMDVEGGEAWVAIADYGSGLWRLEGPYSGDAEINLVPGNYISPGLNYFIAVLAYDGAVVTVHSTALTYDNGLAPPPDITGFSPTSAEQGAEVTFSATNAGGEATGWSWDFGGAATPNTSTEASPTVQITGNPDIFMVSVTATNPADSSEFQGNFEVLAPPPVTYLGTMQAIFANNCMPCHSTGSATFGIVLDTYWNANENSAQALSKALIDHAPSGSATLTQEEKDDFQAWVDGGLEYGEDVNYTNYVTVVTSARCGPCHVSGGNTAGVNWDTYENSWPNASRAWTEIRKDDMPASGGPLTSEQKDKWLAWIEQGTPE